MAKLSIVCALALLIGSNWVAVQAAAVHKWVDERGVTHYSDAAPDAADISVVQLEINTGNRSTNAAAETSDHYYSTDQRRTDYDDEERSTRYVAAYPTRLHRRRGYRKRYPRQHRSYYHTRQSNPQPASLGSFPTTN